MVAPQISRKSIATLVFVALATGLGAYWFWRSRADAAASTTSSSEMAPTSQTWRDLQLNRSLPTTPEPQNWVRALVTSADGTRLVSGSENNTVDIWDLATTQRVRTLSQHKGAIASVALSPNGKIIASSSEDKTVKLWNASTGELLHNLDGFASTTAFVGFSADGQTLIAVSQEQKSENDKQKLNRIKTWDLAGEYEEKDAFWGTGETISAIAWEARSQILVLGYEQANRVDLWHLGQGKQIGSLPLQFPQVQALALSSRSSDRSEGEEESDAQTQVLAVSGEDLIEVWEWDIKQPHDFLRAIGTGESIQAQKQLHLLAANTGIVSALAFSPDGQTLFAGTRERAIRIWDVGTGDLIRILKGNSAWIEAIALSPDGNLLVAGSNLGEIKLASKPTQTSPIKQEVAQNVKTLQGTRRCQQCDLGRADLRNFMLAEVDLQWANLSGANLSGANLRKANLQNAILVKADLSGATLTGANLEGANLAGAKLEGAQLDGANLTGANLTGTSLEQPKPQKTLPPKQAQPPSQN